MTVTLPIGMASAIGALPFDRPDDAVDFVVEHLPGLPAAPPIELDARHPGPAELASDTIEGIEAFCDRLRGRAAPVLASVTGPITVELRRREATAMDGPEDEAETHGALDSAIESVVATAGWLVDRLAAAMPSADVWLFLDEPGLARSMHPTFPLAPESVERALVGAVSRIGGHHRAGTGEVAVGLHVVGRADWSMVVRTGIDALAAPLNARLEDAAGDVASFVERGGVIAWGAVPTDEPLGASPERLWKRLSAVWCELTRSGADPMRLREQSIITPSGSLARHGRPQVEQCLVLAQELAVRIRRQSMGVRLSIGA